MTAVGGWELPTAAEVGLNLTNGDGFCVLVAAAAVVVGFDATGADNADTMVVDDEFEFFI